MYVFNFSMIRKILFLIHATMSRDAEIFLTCLCWCIHSAAGGWCTLLSVLMLVCMGISWWTHSTPKIQNQNKWRIFLKKRKAIWIYIIFEKLERPEISNVLEELCLQFAEYIFGKIFEKTISIQLQQLFGGKYLWFTFQFRRNFCFSWQRNFYRNM